MKTRPTLQTKAMTFLAMTAMLLALAGPTAARADDSPGKVAPPRSRGQSAIDPITGLPSGQWAIDPKTGLPIEVSWKDPDWPDPDKVLSDVDYDGLPLEEVARQLRAEFKDAFDVLIPNGWQDPHNPNVELDPRGITVRMQLKNVTASEVFNAMNLMFKGENTPCRWELRMNGNRPTAILRIVPELLPAPPSPPPEPAPLIRQIYFVGDLIGDAKSGGMTMEQLVKTMSEVYGMSYGQTSGVLQYHKGAQLVIVTGTKDQVGFVEQTLAALRDKVRMEQASIPEFGNSKTGKEDPKPR